MNLILGHQFFRAVPLLWCDVKEINFKSNPNSKLIQGRIIMQIYIRKSLTLFIEFESLLTLFISNSIYSRDKLSTK